MCCATGAVLAGCLRTTDMQFEGLVPMNLASWASKPTTNLVVVHGVETEVGVMLQKRPTHH